MFLRVRLLRLKQLLLHNWLSLKPSQQPLRRKVWARIPLSIWNEMAVHVFYFFLVGGGGGGGADHNAWTLFFEISSIVVNFIKV